VSVVGRTSGTRSQQAAAQRRRQGRRRLRGLAVVLVLVAVAIAAVLVTPYAKKAIQKLTLPLPREYQAMIRQQASEKHLDPALIAAVIYAETGYDPRTSSAGAEGLMQIEPATAKFLAHKSGATTFTTADLWHPAVNIAYGSYYLRYLLDEFGGSKMLALAAYNGGETNVHNWVARLPSGQRFTVSDIPFSQTRAYVTKVLKAQREYQTKYAKQLGYG
jgi:soluble lytic murein transglycosylase